MPLRILAGPGCFPAGKQRHLDKHRGPTEVVIDVGEIYRSLGGREDIPSRDPVTLRLAFRLRKLAIKIARDTELDGIVTTSNGDRAALDKLAREAGATAIHVLAPTRDVVCRRIDKLVSGDRAKVCEEGLSRWYDRYRPAPGDVEVTDD